MNFPGSVLDIEYFLPEKVLTNKALEKEFPSWNISATTQTIGVESRHHANLNQTAYDLSVEALKKLLKKRADLINEVDGLLFCTQSPDYIMPSNSFLLMRDFEFTSNTFCLDFNLACSGYLSALIIASGLIKTNVCSKILIFNADTYSKYIHPKDRSTRLLFGDGAAVSIFGEREITTKPIIKKILHIEKGADGTGWDKFIIKAGGLRNPLNIIENIAERVDKSGNVKSNNKIEMDGFRVLSFVNGKVIPQIRSALLNSRIDLSQIEYFIFHQASQVAIDTIVSRLKIDPARVLTNIKYVGNTVSASIPILLKETEHLRPRAGKALISGFGVGFSYFTLIVEV
jgi:3-oxoacyl-[acyl-carrier-protein] synthase III